MEYGTTIGGQIIDNNYMKHVGYSQNNDCIKKFFSEDTIRLISRKVTELTMGIDPQNRPIIVPATTIASIMSSIQENYRPETGDIYTRYNIPSSSPLNMVQRMIDMTIEVIFNDINVNMGMEAANKKLNIWTTVLGDFNTHGLRSHAPITSIRRKKPQTMLFNLNY
jgi:hypothetical protein